MRELKFTKDIELENELDKQEIALIQGKINVFQAKLELAQIRTKLIWEVTI